MKKNKLLFLTFVPIIVLGAFIILKNDTINSFSNSFSKAEELKSFCINNLCLNKKEDAWFYKKDNKEIPADSEVTNSYAKKLNKIKLENLSSNNPTRLKEFGFDDKKVVIKIKGLSLEIGKISNDYMGTFVKKENDNNIYYIDTLIDRNNLDNESSWGLRFITNISEMQVKKITAKNMEYSQFNGKWEKQESINTVLHLTSEGYFSDIKPENSEEFEYKIEGEKETIKLSTGKTKDKKYWATTDQKYFYLIKESDYVLLTALNN